MTITDALNVAAYLTKSLGEQAQAIGIFGSVERNFRGNDLDIVIFTCPSKAQQFRQAFAEWAYQNNPDKKAKETFRRRLTKTVLMTDTLAPTEVPENDLDILLLAFSGDIDSSVRDFFRYMHPSPMAYCGTTTAPKHMKVYLAETNSFAQYQL